ncbi:hypothetical protein RU97_GL002610 [Enterococcus canis]|uniref:ABC transmembrane type-1 domain-containing protein n=1 Tax=Enterococcus canis TaxID=214095 RepID=A0A1L8RD43_9ENTE|nr:ABC transporter permease subunit [Enterococcus canis]OJG17602.1 hypothetical protein RU97_GL002610 [Enterococcus canis]
MKKIITMCLLAVSLVCLGGWSSAEGSDSSSQPTSDYLQAIQEKGELVVGTSADFAPFEFHKTINGKDEIVGADIDIAQAIADDLGVKLKVMDMDFNAVLAALQNGQVDLAISGISATPERQETFDFSEPYYNPPQRLLINVKNKDKLTDIAAFNGLKVGAQKGSLQEIVVQEQLSDAHLISLAKVPNLVNELKQGSIEGLVLEEAIGESYISQNKDIMFSDAKLQSNADEAFAIALPKNSGGLKTQVDASLKKLVDGDKIDEFVSKAVKLADQDETQSVPFAFLKQYYPYFLSGVVVTLIISVIVVFFGTLLGILFALMKLSSVSPLRWIANVYIEVLRGTPMLVQILIGFGILQHIISAPIQTIGVLDIDLSRLLPGIIVLSMNSGAYVAEIVRGGINAVNKGQTEAAHSLGLRPMQTMRYVILPQALRNILPALGNEFITVIKDSSLLSTIGIYELLNSAQIVVSSTFIPLEPLYVAAAIYFILTFTTSRVLGLYERKLGKGYQR